MAFTVTEAFYRLIEAKENLKVAQEALQQRQEFAKLTDAFFQAGKITHLDSFRAQSQVSEAEQAVVEADNAVRLAREILARTMGLKEPVPVDIKGELPREFAAAATVDTLWQETLKTNPEIKRLRFGDRAEPDPDQGGPGRLISPKSASRRAATCATGTWAAPSRNGSPGFSWSIPFLKGA